MHVVCVTRVVVVTNGAKWYSVAANLVLSFGWLRFSFYLSMCVCAFELAAVCVSSVMVVAENKPQLENSEQTIRTYENANANNK